MAEFCHYWCQAFYYFLAVISKKSISSGFTERSKVHVVSKRPSFSLKPSLSNALYFTTSYLFFKFLYSFANQKDTQHGIIFGDECYKWFKIMAIYSILCRWKYTGDLFKNDEDIAYYLSHNTNLLPVATMLAIITPLLVLKRKFSNLQIMLAVYRCSVLEYLLDISTVNVQRLVLVIIIIELIKY